MIIQEIIGNIDTKNIKHRNIDWLCLEWYETGKRVLRKRTNAGKELSLKFLNNHPGLMQGDILYEDELTLVAVDVQASDCLVIQPRNMQEMASVCYEIGNKHLPLFFEENSLLVPFEQPLFRILAAQGYHVKQEKRKLLHPLKTTVSPHAHGNETLFSRIMKLTTSHE